MNRTDDKLREAEELRAKLQSKLDESKATDWAVSVPLFVKTDDGREISIKQWEPLFDARRPNIIEVSLVGYIRVSDLVSQLQDEVEAT